MLFIAVVILTVFAIKAACEIVDVFLDDKD